MAFYLKPTEVQSTKNASQLGHLWVERLIGKLRKLSGDIIRDKSGAMARSEATKLSGARMPEQRRAGQLVRHKLTSNEARKAGLLTVVSFGVVSGEASDYFERPSRDHFSLDSRQQAILV